MKVLIIAATRRVPGSHWMAVPGWYRRWEQPDEEFLAQVECTLVLEDFRQRLGKPKGD